MNPLKRAAVELLSLGVLPPPSYRPIFVFHDVSEPSAPQYSDFNSTRPEVFRRQIEFLAGRFKLVTLPEVIAAAPSRDHLAAVTFDDGFRSVREVAQPILRAFGAPFSAFVNSSAIVTNHLEFDQYPELSRSYASRVFLDADDVKALRRDGALIGSHTASHRMLRGAPEEVLSKEVNANKAYLEDLLGEEISHFAIPYGKKYHYDDAAISWVFNSGHQFCYSSNPSMLRVGEPGAPRLLIPRIGLTNHSPKEICFMLNRAFLTRVDI